MKKLCAVLLLVFVATLFASSMAFAANATLTRAHIDYMSIDTAGIKHNLRPGYNVGLKDDVVVSVQNNQRIIRHVSKDKWHLGKEFVFQADPTGTSRKIDMTSSDYDLMRLYSPDLRTFFNVPQSVVNDLYGGNGSFAGKNNKDPYGFTEEFNHAFEIVNKLALNPADGGHFGEGGILAVHMFSVDLTAGQVLGKDTIVVPVGLNYEFYSDDYERALYFDSADGRIVTGKDIKPADCDFYKVTACSGTGSWIVGSTVNGIFGTNRFSGMKAKEIKLVKVYGNSDSNKQIHFQLVDDKAKLEHGKFVIVKSVCATACTICGVTDTALKPDDVILNDAPYRILFAIRDQEPNFDFTNDDSYGCIVDPVLVYAENPFLKQIRIKADGAYENTVEELAWDEKLTTHSDFTGIGAFRIATMTGPGTVSSHPCNAQVWAFMDDQAYPTNGEFLNDYPAIVRDTFDVDAAKRGAKKDNMVWIMDSVIKDQYGFDTANVHQFPMTLGRTTARQNTGIVMFSLRDLTAFVGKKVSDVRIINADAQFGAVTEYTLATDKTGMVNGKFAVLQRDTAYPAANYTAPYKQVMMAADEVFEEGKAYFVALAAKDGGDFDVQQGRQGIADSKNDRVIHFSAFAVVGGGTTPVVPVNPFVPVPTIADLPAGVETPAADVVHDNLTETGLTTAAQGAVDTAGKEVDGGVQYYMSSAVATAILAANEADLGKTPISQADVPVFKAGPVTAGATAAFAFTINPAFAGKTVGNVKMYKAINGTDAPAFGLVQAGADMADKKFAIVSAGVVKTASQEVAAGDLVVYGIKDGGEFDLDGAADGSISDPVLVACDNTGVVPPVGGSSGGCSVGTFAPAAVILLAPLFLLLKK